ncbi:MAG: PKD domain-containing protein, partial [Actinomycetales bacterium]|nr:PKD domain-containing protein [Actinomycetales bacterium]
GLAGFELFPRDGAVFYNDPASQRAGVILVDGSVKPVLKYDPADPARGIQPQTGGSGLSGENGRGPEVSQTSAPTTASRDPRTRPDSSGLRVQVTRNPAVAGLPLGLRVSARQGRVTTATWSFGDRTPQVNGVEVGHTWVVPGSYRVSVRARLDNGRVLFTSVLLPVVARSVAPTTTGTRSPGGPVEPPTPPATPGTTTTVPADQPPTAVLSLGSAVELHNAASADVNGSTDDNGIVAATLDWGDGTTGSAMPIPGPAHRLHTYDEVGTFTVTLTVVDGAGQSDTDTATVTVTDPRTPPTVSLGSSTASVLVGAPLNLVVDWTDDGSTVDLVLDWGDGDTTTGTLGGAQRFANTYSEVGSYTVRATVTDTDGLTASDTVRVTVTEPDDPPVAGFYRRGYSYRVGIWGIASQSSDDHGIVAAVFDWGDGESTTLPMPLNDDPIYHDYPNEVNRTYTIVLTVTDTAGQTDTETRTYVAPS